MPEQFQPIPVHGFREISLHHLQPFLHFLHIRASISKPISWEMHIGDSNLPKQFYPIPMFGFQEIDPYNLNHFRFFSISVHPLTIILLSKVHNNDRSMLIKF